MNVQRLWGTPPNIPYKPYQMDSPVSVWRDCIFYVWKDANLRGRITMIKGGKATTEYIDPKPDYIGSTDSHNTYSLGIDKHGYIHIVGDMHNHRPNRELPSRYHNATNLYWCSTKPGDITNFEFRGNHPTKKMPTNENTYISFHLDRKGTLFYMARVRHRTSHFSGKVGLGLYRYDTDSLTWTALGDYPPITNYPKSELIKMIVWEDDGHSDAGGWYQWAMAHINFDLDNNLHLATVWNNNRSKFKATDLIHALSRDGGNTWVKMSSNTPIKLPLRVEPGPHQADIVSHGFDGLEFANAGTSILVDKYGSPGIFVQPYDPNDGRSRTRYVRWLRDQKKWSDYTKVEGWYWHRPFGYLHNSGVLQVAIPGGSPNGIWQCDDNDIHRGKQHKYSIVLVNIANQHARDTGELIGLYARKDKGFDMYKITFESEPEPEPTPTPEPEPTPTPEPEPDKNGFYYINIRTGEERPPIGDIPSANWTIGYYPSQATSTVEFYVNGSKYHTERTAPYIISGDNIPSGGDINPLRELFPCGTIISVATDYSDVNDMFIIGGQVAPTPTPLPPVKIEVEERMITVTF